MLFKVTLLYKSVCVMCAHDNIEDRRVKHMETTRTYEVQFLTVYEAVYNLFYLFSIFYKVQ